MKKSNVLVEGRGVMGFAKVGIGIYFVIFFGKILK